MSYSSDDFGRLGALAGPTQRCLDMLRAVSANPKMNEQARKEIFISYLRSIFPEPSNESRITALAGGAETFRSTLPSSLSSSTRGFADTLNGKLVIEFKVNLLDRSAAETAETELKRYVASLWTSSGPEASFCCIATDILRWCIWRPVPNASPPDGRYTADMVVLEAVDTLSVEVPPNESSANHLVLLLRRTLIDENLLPLTAENLRRDFGLESTLYALLAPIIQDTVTRFRSNPEVNLAIELWENYQAYNARSTKGFDIAFYTKQLYLVMLSRLMVAAYYQVRVETIVDDTIISDILTGAFFISHVRLANFVDRDFFGWTTSEPWIHHFLPLARQIYHLLRSYDFSTSTGENVFRLIYDEMMPAEQQELLGQRSTPEALATAILQTLLQHSKRGYRYLDPACGSGSFLRVALQETAVQLASVGLPLQQQLGQLINAVTGIDVDPIAVILAKATWALTMARLLQYAAAPVHIPIYHADALFTVNDQAPITREKRVKTLFDNPYIVFDNARIDVPLELFNNIPAFDQFVNWCYRRAENLSDTVRTSSANPLEAIQAAKIDVKLPAILGSVYSPELEEKTGVLLLSVEQLVKEFAQRILIRRNGIWAFILRNSYRPSLFAGRFDFIASNPPWLAMSHLPGIPYKEQLLRRAEYFHIRPTGSSFLHAEIATTFALHNVFHFLAEEGWAAFIMPRTLFDGDQHQPFRLFLFGDKVPFAIKEIWDLGQVEGLFKIPSCVVFGTKDSEAMQNPNIPIPTRFWTSLDAGSDSVSNGYTRLDRLGQKTAWVTSYSPTQVTRLVKERLSNRDTNVAPTSLISYSHYTIKFRQGADLMPRTALFVELVNENPAQTIVSIRTSRREVANQQNKVLKERTFRGSMNRRYLFSTITSNQLLPFIVLEEAPTVALPIEFDKEGRISILSSQELLDQGDIETDSWFKVIDRALDSKKIRDRIDERKKLTQQRRINEGQFLVHYGAGGTHPCAGIQKIDSQTQPFIADQTTYVGIIDDEDEAYYLIGMLNAPILGTLIQPFQDKGAFGARHVHKAPLDLVPPYNPTLSEHQRVVALSKSAVTAAHAALTHEMRDQARRLENRRALLRAALSGEINDLNEVAREVLQA